MKSRVRFPGSDPRSAAGLRSAMPGVFLLVLAAAGLPTTVSAQDQAVHDHGADTGWTVSGSPSADVDSLPAFRPDSLQEEIVREVESAPSPLAGRPTARDSADSVAALLRGRRPTLSVHGGVNFLDLDAKEEFQAALESRLRRDSLDALQPYEPVHIALPVGIQALWPLGPWFDLVARTQSYWYKQTAVLGRQGGATVGEQFFAVQTHLGGGGLRYYVPPALLSVSGKLGLYVQGVYYWLLGASEIYTNYGVAPAKFDPAGSAWEIQLGFNRAATRFWSISGSLGFLQQHYLSDRTWSAILVDNVPPGKVEWSASALQASFQCNWHFGVKTPAPIPAASPAVPPTPAGGNLENAPQSPSPAK